MTPRTRKSNQDANYKVYYSKKVPQQVRFPHKKKTVRRPDQAGQDEVEKRQMKFLPERMRHHNAQEHGGSEREEEGGGTAVREVSAARTERSTPVNKRRAKKRKSNDIHEEPASGSEHAVSSSKRQRRSIAQKVEPSRTLRRQSTMTQLADGRRPSSGDDEPDYKPIKRRSRVSSGGIGAVSAGDKRQRTLTQMIPGMGRLSKEEVEELSDLDADLDGGRMTNNHLLHSLIEQGVFEVDECVVNQETGQDRDDSLVAAHLHSSFVLPSFEAMVGDDGDDYQPSPFIEAPTLKTRQTPRRTSTRKPSSAGPAKSTNSRFSLLSTPEKRQIFEIPSSQSPAESVLSPQISTSKSNRSVLRERNNNVTIIAETPSKRRQVTFLGPTTQPALPARLRKFKGTIQDSEDDESEPEDEIATQQPPNYTDPDFHGKVIGIDTQAMLSQIDQACASERDDQDVDNQDILHELEKGIFQHQPYRPSPELGESWAPVIYDDDGPQFESYRSSYAVIKSQSCRNVDRFQESRLPFDETDGISQLDLTTQTPLPAVEIPCTPPLIHAQLGDDIPSTPMVIRDELSDDEAAEPDSTPTRTMRRVVPGPSTASIHRSTDLDGEPVQVPRSPSADRETQHSHSSKAEQQLQHEWLSYSQYVHVRAPSSSSMHATADALSYNVTPRRPKQGVFIASSSRVQHSQATTVDELTPKKNKTQRNFSADTTPRHSSKSQLFVSPEKPPSLFIPSSFPSPSRAAMDGWSSPVMARTQPMYGSSQMLGSLEDFSIPLPPFVDED